MSRQIIGCLSVLAFIINAAKSEKISCGPAVEEGQSASLTCDFESSLFCMDTGVTWWVQTPANSKRLCILGPQCKKTRKRYLGFGSSSWMGEDSGTSILTIRKVSRSSEVYGPNSRWFCQFCRRVNYVCNELRVYVKPENAACKTLHITDENDVLQFIIINCTTSRVYPEAKCDFKRILKTDVMHVAQEPHYTHTHKMDLNAHEPDFFSSECSVKVPVKTNEDPPVFEVLMYPHDSDGEKYGVTLNVSDIRQDMFSHSKDREVSNGKEPDNYRTAFVVTLVIAVVITSILVIAIAVLARAHSKKVRQENLPGCNHERSQQSYFERIVPSEANDQLDAYGINPSSGVYEGYQYVDLHTGRRDPETGAYDGYAYTSVSGEMAAYDVPELEASEPSNPYHHIGGTTT